MIWLVDVLASLGWFLVGACVGSFLNVVMYRSDRGGDWVRGRSKCDFCEKPIAWFDNIPLLSFAALGGKTRCCKQKLSISHPVVEGLIGFLFLWWWLLSSLFFRLTMQPFLFIQPLFWLLIGILLVWIVIEDWQYMYIPVWALVWLSGLALAYRLVLTATGVMQLSDLLNAMMATSLIVLFFYLLHWGTRGKGMGLGDVLLVAPLALLLGWPRVLPWLFLSFTIGAVVGVGVLLFKRGRLEHHRLPFGPFLVLGFFLSLLWGEAIWQWYLSLLLIS